jgi:hypothetical protein
MSDIECPYCGSGQDINHDDGQGYKEDTLHEQECNTCNKTFTFYTHISFFYTAYQADCLNGSEHKYKLTKTWPKEFSRMQCEDCEHERELTEEERITNKIRTKKEYIDELDASCKKLKEEREIEALNRLAPRIEEELQAALVIQSEI